LVSGSRFSVFGQQAGHFIGMALFALLSSAFLWLSGIGSPWLRVAVSAPALVICVLLPDRRWLGRGRGLLWLMFAYTAAVLVSALMHRLALGRLDPAAYITVARGTAFWGEGTLMRQTGVYLLFPLLLVISMALFQNMGNGLEYLKMLPLLVLPSLGVAVYQAYVDFHFWNPSARVWTDRVSGLGSDVNGFGMTLFLLFPITLMSLVLSRDKTKKTLYSLLLVLMCWAVFLSGSRTAFGGILLVIILSLPVHRGLMGKKISAGRMVAWSSAAVLVAALLVGGVLLKGGWLQEMPLARRLQHSFESWKRTADPRRLSSRWELGQQAVRMIRLSPWAGWGPGGFWRQVDNMRARYGEHRGYIDNAENLYLQVAAELGLPLLVVVLLFFLVPVHAAIRIRDRIADPRLRFAVGMVVCTLSVMMVLCLTGPHTFSPEVAWIVCALLGCLFSTGLKFGWQPALKTRFRARTGVAVAFMVVFAAGTYASSLGSRGYAAVEQASWWPLKNEYGLYLPWENWGTPFGKMVWTSKKSSTRIKMRQNGIAFTIFAHGATARPEEPLTVILSIDGKPFDRLLFSSPGVRKLDYFLPGPGNREIFFQTDVSRTFVPRKLGLGNDRRVLGIALSPIRQHGRLPGS